MSLYQEPIALGDARVGKLGDRNVRPVREMFLEGAGVACDRRWFQRPRLNSLAVGLLKRHRMRTTHSTRRHGVDALGHLSKNGESARPSFLGAHERVATDLDSYASALDSPLSEVGLALLTDPEAKTSQHKIAIENRACACVGEAFDKRLRESRLRHCSLTSPKSRRLVGSGVQSASNPF